jgi:Flp pilus assembly protein TadG
MRTDQEFRVTTVRGPLARFGADDRGVVVVAFTLMLPLLMTAVGVAVDYSRVSSAKARLASAVDAGALSAARDPDTKTNPQIEAMVTSMITANKAAAGLSQLEVKALAPSAPTRIKAQASGCLQLVFASFIGKEQSCFSFTAEAERPGKVNLEIALVLDNSGSMADGDKIGALKTAAKEFTKTLFDTATEPDQIRMSVVPFTLTVNVGNQYANAAWMDTNGQSPIHWENVTKPATGVNSRFDLFTQLGETWGGCVETRPGTLAATDDPPNAGQPASLFVPLFAPDEPGERNQATYRLATGNHRPSSGAWHRAANSYLHDDGSRSLTYSGNTVTAQTTPACPISVFSDLNWASRQKNNSCRYNIGGASNRKSVSGSSRGPNWNCNARPLQRMSNAKATVDAAVDAMTASGNTNIFEGFMWGWRTITPKGPFADGRSYTWKQNNVRNKKIMVVMTDGDNFWGRAADGNGNTNPNLSVYSPMGYWTNNRIATGITTETQARTALDNATLTACTNAKATRDADNAEGVTIYTVGFSEPGKPISAAGLKLLEDCASQGAGKKLFYKATNNAELLKAFKDISTDISRLRLTQ